MDNISVTSSSTVDQRVEYPKKVQMIMTSPDNPMINFSKQPAKPSSTASLRQRGLVSQISYLPTSSIENTKQPKPFKQCRTVSSIDNLPGAFVVTKKEENLNKKQFFQNKNQTTLNSHDEKPKFSKSYNAGKLDHSYDVLKNEVYEDEPISKKSIHSNPSKLANNFDIFATQTEEEPQTRSSKSWKSNKLENKYDIFKQYDPISS